jgi:hypothetical protein
LKLFGYNLKSLSNQTLEHFETEYDMRQICSNNQKHYIQHSTINNLNDKPRYVFILSLLYAIDRHQLGPKKAANKNETLVFGRKFCHCQSRGK